MISIDYLNKLLFQGYFHYGMILVKWSALNLWFFLKRCFMDCRWEYRVIWPGSLGYYRVPLLVQLTICTHLLWYMTNGVFVTPMACVGSMLVSFCICQVTANYLMAWFPVKKWHPIFKQLQIIIADVANVLAAVTKPILIYWWNFLCWLK